jgi:flagellar hook-length control protein FliK
VNIRLYPEQLGTVHVELRLESGTVNVSLQADGDATRDLLRQNLGELRQQLADTGLATGRFDVGGGSQQGSDGTEQNQSGSSANQLDDERLSTRALDVSDPGQSYQGTTSVLDMRL